MSAASLSRASTRFFTRMKGAVNRAMTMDPAAVKMMEETYVSVHMNSRIWMV